MHNAGIRRQFLEAWRQQLEADRMLGVRAIPAPRTTVERVVSVAKRQPTQRPNAAARVAVAAPPPASAACHDRSVSDRAARLTLLDETHVRGCTKCGLCETRTQTVFGQGNPHARLVFVGEAPGFEEDRQGLAFVGRAGQLLTRMIDAMGVTRDDVFICNVLKCRPPNNRDPAADEILACSPYLREQLSIIEPEVLVALGAPASKTILNTAESIGRLRGRFHDYFPSGRAGEGPAIPVMPTYHPAYLLRNPHEKRKAWADLQMVMDLLGLVPPPRSGA